MYVLIVGVYNKGMSNKDRLAKIGERIRKHRKRKGFTQAQLGKLADISAQQISNLEVGRNCSPTAENLINLADALGVKPGDLIK
jgi:transcriptional regulator with XRE-family HTH domain